MDLLEIARGQATPGPAIAEGSASEGHRPTSRAVVWRGHKLLVDHLVGGAHEL